jgi:hypothetical protein
MILDLEIMNVALDRGRSKGIGLSSRRAPLRKKTMGETPMIHAYRRF